VQLPITTAVYRILYQEESPSLVIEELKKVLK